MIQKISMEDWKGYMEECELGYITSREHPEDKNLLILNYTDMAVYHKRWNKYTMTSRGLIVRKEDNGEVFIISKGFDKFFNYGESQEYEEDINFGQIESVSEKMDGSLGISYIFNGELRFATRGSFSSEQAIKATKMFKDKYAHADAFYKNFMVDNPTLLVEIIYPDNRIVVDYGEEEKLVLIGVISNGTDYHQKAVEDVAEFLGMPVSKDYSHYNINDLIKMKKEIGYNEEGWILRFDNGKRLKIKGDEYLDVHRSIYGLSKKMKVKAWMNENIKDLIFSMPEEFRKEIEDMCGLLDCILYDIKSKFEEQCKDIINRTSDKNNVKEFASLVDEEVNDGFIKFIMFKARTNDCKVDEKHVKDYIFRNYKEYVGE